MTISKEAANFGDFISVFVVIDVDGVLGSDGGSDGVQLVRHFWVLRSKFGRCLLILPFLLFSRIRALRL